MKTLLNKTKNLFDGIGWIAVILICTVMVWFIDLYYKIRKVRRNERIQLQKTY